MIVKDKVDGLDWEIKATQYDDPDNETGQHTNGPANIFVRGNGYPWLHTGERGLHRVVAQVELYGADYLDFIEQFGPRNQGRTYKRDDHDQAGAQKA